MGAGVGAALRGRTLNLPIDPALLKDRFVREWSEAIVTRLRERTLYSNLTAPQIRELSRRDFVELDVQLEQHLQSALLGFEFKVPTGVGS